jgi:hypothetical protein
MKNLVVLKFKSEMSAYKAFRQIPDSAKNVETAVYTSYSPEVSQIKYFLSNLEKPSRYLGIKFTKGDSVAVVRRMVPDTSSIVEIKQFAGITEVLAEINISVKKAPLHEILKGLCFIRPYQAELFNWMRNPYTGVKFNQNTTIFGHFWEYQSVCPLDTNKIMVNGAVLRPSYATYEVPTSPTDDLTIRRYAKYGYPSAEAAELIFGDNAYWDIQKGSGHNSIMF